MIVDYKMLGKEEGFKALEYYIILNELCSGCSMCQAICPEDVIKFDEYPYLDGECTKCGYCLEACPRANIDRRILEERIFGKYENDLIGSFKKIVAIKTNISGQDGGAVTYILKTLIEDGYIDAAIVTFHNKQKAYPKIVTDANEILKSSGTKYTMSNCLYLLKEAEKYNNIAIVALPCQIEAMRKFQFEKIGEKDLMKNVKLIIGLFCKSNFFYELFTELIREKYSIDLDSIEKVDIKGKYLHVYLKDSKKKIPMKEVNVYKRHGCKYCLDFSARMADISIGSVGSDKGYSTVIVRTDTGMEVFNKILEKKEIEIIENVNIDSINKLSMTKFEENLKEIKKKVMMNLPFYLRQYGDVL